LSDPLLSISNVDKYYGKSKTGVHAVRHLSMNVHAGEIIALLGSSGCGKTSTLRMIAGFEEVSDGVITLAGKVINSLAPVKRNVAMAFEGYSLYPPLTVRDNMAFALKSSNLGKSEVSKRVKEVAEMLEITDILDKYPSSISGGQQQRASLGRAQAEANALSDRIAVMEGGNLVQFDSPENLKEKPANLFTGTFIGEPPMNVFDVTVQTDARNITFVLDQDVSLVYPRTSFSQAVVETASQKSHVSIGIRPYALRRSDQGMLATVVVNQWLGDQTHIAASLAGKPVVLVEHDRATDKINDQIALELDAGNLHLFDRQSGVAFSHGAELA